MKGNTKGVLLFIIFFIVGLITYRDFFDLVLPDVKGVYYIDNSFTVVFMNTLLYSLTIGLIPISCAVVWKMAPIISVNRKLLSIIIILVCLSIAILFGYKNVLTTANKLKAANANNLNEPTLQFPLKKLNTERYMFFSIITVSIICYFLLREKKFRKNHIQPH